MRDVAGSDAARAVFGLLLFFGLLAALLVAELIPPVVGLVLATASTCLLVFAHLVPSLRATLSSDAAGLPLESGSDLTRQAELSRWLLGLRWIAVIMMAAVVLSYTELAGLAPASTGRRLWYLVALLTGFNVVLECIGARRMSSQSALTMQVAVDAVVLGLAIHQAGGLANPFAVFFVFHVMIACLLLSPTWARAVSAGIALFVILLTAVEASGLMPPGDLLVGSAPDRLLVAGAGLAVATLSGGCALVLTTLVGQLQLDRARLGRTTRRLRDEAARLTAARAELLAEQDKLQSVMDCMGDAMLFVTPTGAVTLHNRAALSLWPDRQIGEDLRVDPSRECWRRLREVIASPRSFEGHPLLQIDGRVFEATYARVCEADGRLVGVVMVARDITERIRANEAFVRSERMATIGRLAAALAHELNNPLGAMVLFAEEAVESLRPEDSLRDYLGTVLRNARLCRKIVRDLLEYSRQRPPERTVIVPSELLDDVARTLEPHCGRSGVVLETRVVADLGRELYGDPDQLRQVLVNLGLNAIDAMPDGGRLRFAVMPAERDGIRIEVVDTGVGIADDDKERIFTAFYTTKAKGTGLGLAVVWDLVAAHGGTLALQSSPDAGSTFSVVLPPRGTSPFIGARA